MFNCAAAVSVAVVVGTACLWWRDRYVVIDELVIHLWGRSLVIAGDVGNISVDWRKGWPEPKVIQFRSYATYDEENAKGATRIEAIDATGGGIYEIGRASCRERV